MSGSVFKKFFISHPTIASEEAVEKCVKIHHDPYEACRDAHAIAVCTEWDEFAALDWKRIYDQMLKPAFVFDGRNVLNHRFVIKNSYFEIFFIKSVKVQILILIF